MALVISAGEQGVWHAENLSIIFRQKGLEVLFLSLILGIQSRINVCGSWVTSQKSLKTKVNHPFLLCLQLEMACSKCGEGVWRKESWISCWQVIVFVCVWPPGAGSLRAKFELSNGPSNPSTLAVQFMKEGSTLSGVDMELQGTGYRLSLNKKRFATGITYSWSSLHTWLLLYLTHQQLKLHICCSFLRTLYGRLLRWPTTLVLKEKNKFSLDIKIVNFCNASRTPGSICAQSGFCPGGENLTTIKQHWVLNTVKKKTKKKNNKRKRRWAFRKMCRYEV